MTTEEVRILIHRLYNKTFLTPLLNSDITIPECKIRTSITISDVTLGVKLFKLTRVKEDNWEIRNI